MQQIFIGGCGRSGTTLLGSMLGSHSHCIATPESKFVRKVYSHLLFAGGPVDGDNAWPRLRDDWGLRVWDVEVQSAPVPPGASYPELIEGLVRRFAATRGRPDPDIWVDDTPGNVTHAGILLSLFPAARLIHLVRDGRAVTASVLPLDWGPNTAAAAAEWWISRVTRGLAAEALFGASRSLRVHYEDLVLEPEETLRKICVFAGLEFEPDMVSGSGFDVPEYTRQQHRLVGQTPDRDRVLAWTHELRTRQIEIFEYRSWHMLQALGYEIVGDGPIRPPSPVETLASATYELVRDRINRFRLSRRRASLNETG